MTAIRKRLVPVKFAKRRRHQTYFATQLINAMSKSPHPLPFSSGSEAVINAKLCVAIVG